MHYEEVASICHILETIASMKFGMGWERSMLHITGASNQMLLILSKMTYYAKTST